jgi:hypothetical protein
VKAVKAARTSKKKKKKVKAAMMKSHLTTTLFTSTNVSRMHTEKNHHGKKVNLASFFWVMIAVRSKVSTI